MEFFYTVVKYTLKTNLTELNDDWWVTTHIEDVARNILVNVNSRSRSLYVMLSPVRLSVVCHW